MDLELSYMSGAGNLFSVVNIEQKDESIDYSAIAKRICNLEGEGAIKTEGAMFIYQSSVKDVDFNVDFYNPDGSTGMMCGNGARVAVRFAIDNGYTTLNKCFTMADSKYTYTQNNVINKNNIAVYFAPPKQFTPNIDIIINDNTAFVGDFVNVGTPHFIINFDDFTDEIKGDFFTFNLNDIATQIRNHPEFDPAGTNVNFFKIEGKDVFLRTFERGVEAETGACGTGAISTAISLLWKKDLFSPITITPTSGEKLSVHFIFSGMKLANVILEGPATLISTKKISL